jgi:hypothetical protein
VEEGKGDKKALKVPPYRNSGELGGGVGVGTLLSHNTEIKRRWG